MRFGKIGAALAAAAAIVMVSGLAACGTQPEAPAQTSGSEAQDAATSEAIDTSWLTQAIDAEYGRAYSGAGLTTAFIGEPFYDGTIKDENDALEAISAVEDRIGADDTTVLDPVAIRPTEDGTAYYIFRQLAGDASVHGACVKVVADADGKATGLISAILPDVQIANLDEWGTTQEEAEQAVLDFCASEGAKGVEVVPDASEQVVIPLETGDEHYRYVWVVYTDNFYEGSDMPLLAHYVSEIGEYLYSIPVSEPSNADAQAGDAAAFAFDKMEPSTWEGTVELANGGTRELSVPVMVDPETGDTILGDPQRKILCADYADFTNNNTLSPRIQAEDGTFAGNELLVYDTFIRVWDYYDSIGWKGPDGDGTPALLMMEVVDENGDPDNNAYYNGRKWGFQTFAFSSLNAAGEATDVIGHEFTHCVTGTAMTVNLYQNDQGAINEAMSDIMGNLIEIALGDSPDGAWIHGEKFDQGKGIRYFDDPRKGVQPAFTWDAYYVPPVAVGTSPNDNGGVHENSSLLNHVSYELDQAGMEPNDQAFFWMNVALAMSPATDYYQLADLLPWCMEQAGYPQFVDAVRAAAQKGGFQDREFPTQMPEGCGLVTLAYPNEQMAADGCFRLTLMPMDGSDEPITYPGVGTTQISMFVPEGDYVATGWTSVDGQSFYHVAGPDAWEEDPLDDWTVDSDYAREHAFHVTAGQTVELPSKGL